MLVGSLFDWLNFVLLGLCRLKEIFDGLLVVILTQTSILRLLHRLHKWALLIHHASHCLLSRRLILELLSHWLGQWLLLANHTSTWFLDEQLLELHWLILGCLLRKATKVTLVHLSYRALSRTRSWELIASTHDISDLLLISTSSDPSVEHHVALHIQALICGGVILFLLHEIVLLELII